MPAGRDEDDLEQPSVDEQLTGEDSDDAADGDADDAGGEAEADSDDTALPEDEHAEGAAERDAVDEDTAAAPAVAAKPRVIDAGVRSILQEEAQRELDARATEPAHEPQQVETQPDLGLDAGPSPEDERRRIARERMARMRGLDDDDLVPEPDFDANAEPAAEPAKPTQGRDLFPDIEEINSTLDSHAPGAETGAGGVDADARRVSGFSRGFALVILLAVLLAALYVFAPKLAISVPALEPVLASYVEAINALRLWLDETLRGAIEKIEAAAGGQG